jgi:hypothetical protein
MNRFNSGDAVMLAATITLAANTQATPPAVYGGGDGTAGVTKENME